MRPIRLFLCLMFLLAAPVTAQEGYPLPEDLQPITPDNAAQIQELVRIGGALPGSLAWSPDGRWLAAGTSEGVNLYNADNPDEPPRIIDGGADVAFNAAGDVLVSGGQLWDVETGSTIASLDSFNPYGFSPSGNLLVTAGVEGGEMIVRLWDVTTAAVSILATLNTGANDGFYRAVFTPDERRVVLMLSPMQLWDVATETRIATLEYPYPMIRYMAFDDQGRWLVIADGEDTMYGGPFEEVRVWNGETGELAQAWETGVRPVLSPDGTMLFFDSLGYGMRLVLLKSELEVIYLADYGMGDPFNLVFSEDGRTVALTQQYTDIQLWDTDTLRNLGEPCGVLSGEEDILNMVFSPDGQFLAASAREYKIRIWNVHTQSLQSELEDSGREIQFSPSGSLLLVRDSDGSALWDTATGEERLALPPGTVLNGDWTRAAYWYAGTVQVINIMDGTDTELRVIEPYFGYPAVIHAATEQVAFVGDGVWSYDLRTGTQLFALPASGQPGITFSPDGTRIAVETKPIVDHVYDYLPFFVSDRIISLWDASVLHNPLAELEISGYRGDPLFSPDGSMLAIRGVIQGGESGSDYEELWDVETGDLLAIWGFENGGTMAHVFSPSGALLATSGSFGKVTLWDVAATIEQEGETDGLQWGVAQVELWYLDARTLAFSRDGERLAAGAIAYFYDQEQEDHTVEYRVYVWEVDNLLSGDRDIDIDDNSEQVVLPDAQLPLFSPYGTRALTINGAGDSVDFWDAETGQNLASVKGDSIRAFSPDGALLATHSADGISLWGVDALTNGEASPLVTLTSNHPGIQELAFNPDGTLLFVRDTSGVSVWGIP